MPEFLHYFHGLRSLTDPKVVIQLVLIGYVGAWVWRRIKHTQAERLVKGLLVVALIFGVSAWLGLTIITSILQSLIPVAVLALVITFQPEMRRGLGYLGRMERFRFDWSLRNVEVDKSQKDIDQIILAVDELSKNRTGALIVVEPPEGERDYLSPGITVNGDISSSLLLSIFYPNSPLHDGAVVIRRHKVVAAGVILPMTGNPKLSTKYGTRHRAALGLSEIYDGLCIVVSEETGSISAASRGLLVRYAKANELADPLSYIYKQPTDNKQWNPWNTFITFIGRGSKSVSATEPAAPANEQVVVQEDIQKAASVDSVRDAAPSLIAITEDARRSDLDKQSTLSA